MKQKTNVKSVDSPGDPPARSRRSSSNPERTLLSYQLRSVRRKLDRVNQEQKVLARESLRLRDAIEQIDQMELPV